MEELADILSYTRAGETVNIVVKELESGEYIEKVVEVSLGSKADIRENSSSEQSQNDESQSQQQEEQQQFRKFFSN